MKHWSIGRALSTLAASGLLWAVAAGACFLVGSTGNFGWPASEILPLRLESVLMASLVGAALAAAGVVYQAILRNPLADPYLLGVSSGASLFSYLWTLAATTSLLMLLGLAPHPYQDIAELTSTGRTATVLKTDHGYSTGDAIEIDAVELYYVIEIDAAERYFDPDSARLEADASRYGGTFKITASSADVFTYTMDGTPKVTTAVPFRMRKAHWKYGEAFSQQAFAFVGATVAVVTVLVLASSRGRLEPITLLLVGVIVNAVTGALFLLLNSMIRDQPGTGGPMAFLVGSINTSLTSHQKYAALIFIGLAFIIIMYIAGQLNIAVLGEGEAESLGVRIHRLRWIGLVIASLMAAAAVAVSGPIGFVGLVCPHLARLVVGGDVRRLLPVATALGASLLALADVAARVLSRPGAAGTSLPVGVLTALMGGPFFLLLLWQNRRRLMPEGPK